MSSFQSQLLDVIKSKKHISEELAFELFDAMEPAEEAFLIGTWTGGPVETGHQTSKWCEDVKFAGKKFNSLNDVEPVFVYNDAGARVFYEPNGLAQIREVKYRGVVTATLIYDTKPILDYFRKVDDNTVIAAADNKAKRNGTFFFYLVRGKKDV